MWSFLGSYSFWIVSLGTALLALASGLLSCLTVARGEELLGDAIGHASYPGIVLAYLLFLSKEPLLLLLGAFVTACLACYLIVAIPSYSPLRADVALAVVLSGFFGVGMLLKSYVQGHPAYASASQAGLDNYLFGQAAYIREADLYLIAGASSFTLLLLILLRKEFKLLIFDPESCNLTAFRPAILNALLILMMLSVIVAGLKLIGFLLISTFLVLPGLTARQCSARFHVNLLLAASFSVLSAFLGSLISSLKQGLSTGPVIIVIMTVFFFLSLFWGAESRRAKRRRAQSWESREVTDGR